MMLVDKETGKGYVEMEKVHHDKKEYASKGVAGTALGLGIAGTALALLTTVLVAICLAVVAPLLMVQ